MKEEKIEWVENPFPKKYFTVFCIAMILLTIFASVLQLIWSFKNPLYFFLPYLPVILPTIVTLYIALFAFPRQVGFSDKGVFFRYRRGNVKSIPWNEIYKVELIHPSKWVGGGGRIFLKSGKELLIGISYNIACEIRRRHEEYKRERGLL